MDTTSGSACAEQPGISATPAGAPTASDNRTIRVEGILDADPKGGAGRLLDKAKNSLNRQTDTYVSSDLIRHHGLRRGSMIVGRALPPEGRYTSPTLDTVETVDGLAPEARRRLVDFSLLTTVSPDKHLKLEMKDGRMTTRAVDLFCPIGRGTRGLVVAPPRTGKTILLRDMALGVLENNPECHVMILLVDERPEEVTDFRRGVPAELWAS